MSIASFANKLKTSVLNTLSGDMSKVFVITTVISYIAGSTAQLCGISKNDKLTPDKRKFLRFQEMADCAINTLAYFTITKGCIKMTKHLASSGKILSKGIADGCKLCDIDLKNVKNIGSEINQRLTKLENTKDVLVKRNVKIADNSAAKINDDIKNLYALKDQYVPFENGMSMIGTIGGGLVSADLIAPVLRNKYAAVKQKQEQPSITYNSPVFPTNGSMKI